MANPPILGSHSIDPESLSLFLKSLGILDPVKAIASLKGGANNQVYKIEFERAKPLVLKSYFQHAQDKRPRMKTEFEFSSFAWREGIRTIPEPLGCDPSRNLALYRFIDASLAAPSDAGPSFVEAATSFLLCLNERRKQADHLMPASEACFKTADYIATVEKKLALLQQAPQETPLDEKLHLFLLDLLFPEWEKVKKEVCKTALHSLDPAQDDLIVTPSDLGLHNVLASKDGHYYFIDFEYAGWDDPAKTVCDFFLQPKIPIPFAYFDSFSKQIAALSQNSKKTLERICAMFPICKIKWCCIILNVFLKIGKSRRVFAQNEQAVFLEKQLDLAGSFLTNQNIL